MIRVVVSACLLGEAVRYDAVPFPPADLLRQWVAEGRVILFCPEVSAGLPAPRPPAEIRGNGFDVLEGRARVFDRTGRDVTGARIAVLKERSPSCGSSLIYDGTFQGVRVAGTGVTAALLRRNGIAVFSEDELIPAEEHLRRLEFERDPD